MAKQFRILSALVSLAAVILVGVGIYLYAAKKQWVAKLNTPENVAHHGAVEFRSPVATSNAFYIAGLLLALGGCFELKARQAMPVLARRQKPADDSSLSD